MKTNQKAREVLVVDDSPETVELIKRNLASVGYEVYTAHDVQSAIKLIEAIHIDLLITDLKMPGENGLSLVRHVTENYKGMAVLVITGFPSIQTAVESIKIGAEEYLVKSFTDEELFKAVEKALSKIQHKKPKEEPVFSVREHGIIGESAEMMKVFNTIKKARTAKATVLINGESGTGKELVARALHYGNGGSSGPFVPVNCGGIPDTLLESELFGYIKGAFTGATESRVGFFETAHKGTLFLDEISNTSMAMQAKLLRVLQEKEFYMVGSKTPKKVDVRIVAATNVDLMQLVEKGLFREDLYYRLNIITVDLPPLRDRGNDIELLLEFFLNKYTRELDKPIMRFSPKALHTLKEYSWPGNVRELQNLVHRLVVMADDNTIDAPDLPATFRYSATRSRKLDRKLDDVVNEYIQEVLAANQNNLTRAAESLGIDRKTLRSKIRTKPL